MRRLTEDPCFVKVFGGQRRREVRSCLRATLPASVLPDSDLHRTFAKAWMSRATDLDERSALRTYELHIQNRLITVLRDESEIRSDIQRRIFIRVSDETAAADQRILDVPVRSSRGLARIPWRKAVHDAVRFAHGWFRIQPPRNRFVVADGRTDVVFEAGVGAIALHEACGHCVEADVALAGSPLSALMGETVAGESVTLMDDPTIPGALGSYSVDDEGRAGSATVIIERGRLVRWLTSGRYRTEASPLAGGNGRRDSYRNRALPRMSNLVLEAGEASRGDLIGGVARGVLVTSLGVGGESDPYSGRFWLSVRDGQAIEGGRTAGRTGPFIIRGDSLGFLMGIARVGRRQRYKPVVTLCEKNRQRLFTDGISPPFLVKGQQIWGGIR
jgi:hypothetical protein